MSYRHSKNAGNEGDVIKHISLIAALDTVMKSWNNDKGNKDKVFSYCDTYAANGLNLLKSGLGWSKGIGRIQSQMNHADVTINHHFVNWKNSWWIPPEETERKYNAGFYPGSSLFVANLFEKNKTKYYKIRLWDIEIDCIENQFKTFCKHDNTAKCEMLDPKVSLYPESAFDNENQKADFKNHLEQADFLFVDPPSLKIPQTYKDLANTRAVNGNWTMFWFPATRTSNKDENQNLLPKESYESIKARNVFESSSAKILIQFNALGGVQDSFGCQIILVGPKPLNGECEVRNNVKKAINYVIAQFQSRANDNIPNNIETFDAENWGLPYGWDSPDHCVGGWTNANN